MMRSLFSGVAGLKTHQTKMDVIGNNIANVNTVAFKYSSTSFQDIMYQTMSGASGATATKGGKNPNQIGLGVQTGATKVTITKGGAAQSTGEALDIRLSDANSTNFFIVNNGSQNVFTRSGSFYVDGNGNLAMTSTGYLVQGWQVDPLTNDIKRDSVTPLRIMSSDNMTSEPEKTEEATIYGVLDKNDTNVTSTDGYATTLIVYDELGYAYTARFAIKSGKNETSGSKTEKNGYTIALTNLYSNSEKDAAGNPIDLLNNYITQQVGEKTGNDAATAKADALQSFFGDKTGKQTDSFKLNSPTYTLQGGTGDNAKITYTTGGYTFTATIGEIKAALDSYSKTDGNITGNQVEFKNPTPTGYTGDMPKKYVTDIFKGLSGSIGDYIDKKNEGNAVTFTFDESTMQLQASYTAVNYNVYFNANDGTFAAVGAKMDDTTGKVTGGGDSVTLKLSTLGDQFGDINIDFSQMKNFNNGGSSTVGMDTGTVSDKSYKAGKKLGAMTGVSVQQDGKIFGTYDNGNTVLLGQIAVARFANASGLEELGNNCYGQTLNSGTFDGIGEIVTSDGGSMNTGQLEMSNVDLSTEFTEMITTQRGFQANSRIITVSDTMLEELTNLKR